MNIIVFGIYHLEYVLMYDKSKHMNIRTLGYIEQPSTDKEIPVLQVDDMNLMIYWF